MTISLVKHGQMLVPLHEYEGKRVVVKEYKTQRSNEQNRYLWGVVYEMIAAETGYSPEEVHELMKLKFAPRKHMTVGTVETETPRSSATLDTKEFVQYIDRVVAFAASELSIVIPSPLYHD